MSASAYTRIESTDLKVLQTHAEYYQHACGLQHLHLQRDHDDEYAFTIAFRTPPEDSTGVAHILEHLSLCGGKTFPVKDPFFAMLRRSLSTFMNAMTASDWTAYPFATRSKKDFLHLFQVYTDAVGQPLLRLDDFQQEGHRLQQNPKGDIEFAGVVYNEMKGSMSSVVSQIWEHIGESLMPGTCYQYNSGGDPASIIDLTYDQLVQFHRKYYCPANAIVMSSGPISAAEIQDLVYQYYLESADNLGTKADLSQEPTVIGNSNIVRQFAASEPNQDQLLLAWRLQPITDLDAYADAMLVHRYLAGHGGAPLLQAMEATELAKSVAAPFGLATHTRQMALIYGLQGLSSTDIKAAEAFIRSTIEEIASQPIDQQQVQAVFDALEFEQLQVPDSMPTGLELSLSALSAMAHGQSPMPVLQPQQLFEKLRERCQHPEFINQWLRKHLLENTDCISLHMQADKTYAEKDISSEQQRLEAVLSKLNPDERQQIDANEQQRLQRQQQFEEDSKKITLPCLNRQDLERTLALPKLRETAPGQFSGTVSTPGCSHYRVLLPIPSLTQRQVDLLPLYNECLTELGVGNRSYDEAQKHYARYFGNLNTSVVTQTSRHRQSYGQTMVWLQLECSGLNRNATTITETMAQLINDVRFDETVRISELLDSAIASMTRGIASSGHHYAMLSAKSQISQQAQLQQRLQGLQQLLFLRALADEPIAKVSSELTELHNQIKNQPCVTLSCSDEDSIQATESALLQAGLTGTLATLPMFNAQLTSDNVNLWRHNVQVNYCALAIPVDNDPQNLDAAGYSLLAEYARHHWLHPQVRELGGAYGGGLSNDSSTGTLCFYSYRDPRLAETLTDFQETFEKLYQQKLDDQELHLSRLAVLSNYEKRGAPISEVLQTFRRQIAGSSNDRYRSQRQALVDYDLAHSNKLLAQLREQLHDISAQQHGLSVISSIDSDASVVGDFVAQPPIAKDISS